MNVYAHTNRFVTSHPRYMSMSVVESVAQGGNLCEMFHIPFQAGDDEILKAMGRGHTIEQYEKIVEKIRAQRKCFVCISVSVSVLCVSVSVSVAVC